MVNMCRVIICVFNNDDNFYIQFCQFCCYMLMFQNRHKHKRTLSTDVRLTLQWDNDSRVDNHVQ